MQIHHVPIFGEIDIDALEECYETQKEIDGQIIDFDLNFEEKTTDKFTIELLTKAVNNLELHIQNTNKEIADNFDIKIESDIELEGVVREYIEHHLKLISENELETLLKKHNIHINSKENDSKVCQLFSLLYIDRIGFYPEDIDTFMVFDFVINPELTNYVLVVYVDTNGELAYIGQES